MTPATFWHLTRRELGRRMAAWMAWWSAAGVLSTGKASAAPTASSDSPNAPVVWYAEDVTAENLIALYQRIAGDIEGRVGIKIHGGEAAVNFDLWRVLQESIPESAFIETNWASDFGGARRYTASHIKVIRGQGVDFAPVDVLDREEGREDYRTVPVTGGAELKDVEIPSSMLRDYAAIVVLTNFKIPSFAGYTGCVKNVGIGLVSPDAKAKVHGPGYERIPDFFVRLADAAKGVSDAFARENRKLLHINVITNLKADPVPGCETPKGGNLGIVASLDMVAADQAAVDQAAVDLIWGLSPEAYDAMDEKTKIDRGFLQLECLGKIGAGSRTYRLEHLSTTSVHEARIHSDQAKVKS